MAKNYKKIDWNELKNTIPGKPDTWKVETLGKFLKLCDLSGLFQKFKENAIDGNLFLTISEDDDEWDDLELPSKDEQALKYYQQELKKYNESFFDSSNKLNKLGNNASQFKEIFDKKTIPVEIVQSQWFQEEEPRINFKKKKEEEKKIVEEDEEATIKKIKKPKKPNPVPEEENDSEEDKTIQRKQKTPKLVLVQNVKDKAETLTFKKSFTIHRDKEKKSLSDSIYIEHREISRNHAEVHYIPKSGYFFQDLKSSNHSYLKVPDDCNLILRPSLELIMGESLITIEKIETKKVVISVSLLFEKEEDEIIDLNIEFLNSNEVIFGRNPSKKKPAVCKLNSDIDKKIENEHAKFIKGENNVTLKPLAKVFIKLGDEERASDLYLLKKGMEIKLGLGEVNFIVQDAYPEKIRTKCGCSNNNIAILVFPCKHTLCSDCGNNRNKKCKECGADIQGVFRLFELDKN